MARDLTRLSRVLSHALRHEPWLYELELDDAGWTDIGPVLAAMRRQPWAWPDLGEQDLVEMIRTGSKQRHEIAGSRIRALYGHSVPGRLHRTPAAPPALLFHGTSPSAAGRIAREGLRPMRRQYVHLSVDRETAQLVGARKAAAPIILAVRAADAAAAGIRFYAGNDKVWLADHVPAAFIDGLP